MVDQRKSFHNEVYSSSNPSNIINFLSSLPPLPQIVIPGKQISTQSVPTTPTQFIQPTQVSAGEIDPNITKDIERNLIQSPIKVERDKFELPLVDIARQDRHIDTNVLFGDKPFTIKSSTPIIISKSPNQSPTTECCVCMDEQVSENGLLQCKHAVCATCITRLEAPECPVCRGKLIGGIITQDIAGQIGRRKRENIEHEARLERIRDEMSTRATIILNQNYFVDTFDGIEYTRQSLRDYDPLEFTTEKDRKKAVNLVVKEVIKKYKHGLNGESVYRAVDKAYTLTGSDLIL